MTAPNPYSNLPQQAFWRSGVAECGPAHYAGLWSSKWELPANARFSTYGSCFAQHISRALLAKKMHWFDAEPAPGKTPAALAKAYNYGVFSSRTGNIYTAAQLLCWINLAEDPALCDEIEIWEDGGRFRDSLRPAIEPRGFASAHEAHASLRTAAQAFRRSITDADVFVFTLGLTEGWENRATGQPYPLCPGTAAGTFDADAHVFKNYTYPEIAAALNTALARLWALNPALKVLFTVSPVPLTATACEGTHVLVATTYSKSTLRAVAGDFANTFPAVDYFPSFEIISAPPSRGAYFEENLRSVKPEGVALVMGYFFSGLNARGAAVVRSVDATATRIAESQKQMAADDLVCEEMLLEKFNDN